MGGGEQVSNGTWRPEKKHVKKEETFNWVEARSEGDSKTCNGSAKLREMEKMGAPIRKSPRKN